MVILFICGSLQAGRDGVGDYTRRMAGELLRNNHQTAIIALHDRQLNEHIWEGTQLDGEQNIRVLRLSSQLPWEKRIDQASTYIKAIDPDWVSLQYVPFSFHDKGLHVGLSKVLKQLFNGRKIQIMFHELWVGMYAQSPTHYIWWGRLQRYLIRLLINTLKPDVVHTHTPLYQVHLNNLGFRSALLPLFTNIPLVSKRTPRIQQPVSKDFGYLRFVFFGGIYPSSVVGPLASEVASYASAKNICVDLTIIGRNGPEQEVWASVWRSHGLNVIIHGEQSPESISEILSQSSIGLSTTPLALSSKSGAIAAMHAHGLPVLCVSSPCHLRNELQFKTTLGIYEYTIGNLEHVVIASQKLFIPHIDINSVTYQLIDDLIQVNN